MKAYVASKSSNIHFALEPDNVIAVCCGGLNPLGDARSYAYDETKATDGNTYVYEVDLKRVAGYKVMKQVIPFGEEANLASPF